MESVTREELWELANRLSSSQAVSDTTKDVDSVAEAFGVTPEVVRQELRAIRENDELERLRSENVRLKQQIQARSNPSADSVWLNEEHESTTVNGQYIETVRMERSRQPTWFGGIIFIIFIVVAIVMFKSVTDSRPRVFPSSHPEMGLSFPGGEPPPLVRKVLEEQMRERR